MPYQNREEKRELPEGVVYGRNAVSELIRSGKEIECVYVSNAQKQGSMLKILAQARENKIVIKDCDAKKLEQLCGGRVHQGIAAVCSAVTYVELEDLLAAARQKGEPALLLVADGIEDPHNLGAMIRTAECVGAHGVVIPKRRSAGVNATVYKTSAGAASYLPIARVTNIPAALDWLRGQNVWVYGADMAGTCYTSLDLKGDLAFVIGSEGKGISRLVREKCDFLVSLPMKGNLSSLNASVAAAVLLYEAARQRAL